MGSFHITTRDGSQKRGGRGFGRGKDDNNTMEFAFLNATGKAFPQDDKRQKRRGEKREQGKKARLENKSKVKR